MLPPAQSPQHAGTHLQQWSMEQAPDTGSRPPTPAFGELPQGPRRDKSGGGSLTRAAEAAREPRHSARQGRPAGAARAQRSKRCWLPTRRHWEQKRRVRVGAGGERSSESASKWQSFRAQRPESRSKLRTRTHALWFVCHLYSATGNGPASFGHAHLPSSRGRVSRESERNRAARGST